MTPRLGIHQLSCSRNNKNLFHALTLNLSPGQGLLIHGSNGSGKTTLLKILAGLITAEQGSIAWKGDNICKGRHAYHKDLHFLGHHHGLKANLTVKENLIYSQRLTGQKMPASNQIIDTLEKIGLLHQSEHLARQLSAGQKRRLALARLLTAPRILWLLDEPATNLDPQGLAWFCAQVEEHLQNQGIAVIASHQTLPLKNTHLFQCIHLGAKLEDTPHG